MAYEAVVLADSVTERGDRLTTIQVTLPRFVLAEFNTHRDFSRNSASSRAIPLKTQIERVLTDPAMPVYWGANQSGMQASTELSGPLRTRAIASWLQARDDAVAQARVMGEIGAHKQIASRLLEPFMWQTIIVSATQWDNFFALRDNADAQPEFRVAAHMMREVRDASDPRLLRKGEWHLPLLQPDEIEWAKANPELAVKVCIGRCARVSYLTHDGRRDHEKDIELYERLRTGGHMSPFEHVARPMTWRDRILHPGRSRSNFRGWLQHRKNVRYEDDYSKVLAEAA